MTTRLRHYTNHWRMYHHYFKNKKGPGYRKVTVRLSIYKL